MPLTLTGGPGAPENLSVRLHPKHESMGMKSVSIASTIYLEHDDALLIEPNEEVTLMAWGNAIIESVEKRGDVVVSMKGRD